MTKKTILLMFLLSSASSTGAYDSDVRRCVQQKKFDLFVKRIKRMEELLCLNIFRHCYRNLKLPLRKRVIQHLVEFCPCFSWSKRLTEHDDVDATIKVLSVDFISEYSFGAGVPPRIQQVFERILSNTHSINEYREFFETMVPLAVGAVIERVTELDEESD